MKGLGTYISLSLNFGAAYFLMVSAGNPEMLPQWFTWLLILYVIVAALASIAIYGMMCLVWSILLSVDEKEFADGRYASGSDSILKFYEVSVALIVDSVPTHLFWLSVLSSFYLLLQLAVREWYFLVALEIAGSSLGYGYIQWAKKNCLKLAGRAGFADAIRRHRDE